MIDQKSQVEGWISVPRNLAVEQHDALLPHENVLRAVIPVHQTLTRRFQAQRLLFEDVLQSRMSSAGGQQVGIRPQLMKIGGRIEKRCQLRSRGRCAMKSTKNFSG